MKKLKKYEVQIAETRVQIYHIDAKSKEDAENQFPYSEDAELIKDETVEWYINEVEEVK